MQSEVIYRSSSLGEGREVFPINKKVWKYTITRDHLNYMFELCVCVYHVNKEWFVVLEA